MRNKKWLKYTIAYICVLLLSFAVYYITLPPINVHSAGFWVFLAFLLFIFILPICLFAEKRVIIDMPKKKKKTKKKAGSLTEELFSFLAEESLNLSKKKLLLIALIPLVVLMIGGILSSTFFNARRYAAIIEVEEAVFKDDMPECETVTNIALMDSDTASIVGNRTLGSLSHVVSQYEVSPSYTQINYRYTPKKVANLEYAGFFKWLGNRANGLPGYVMVDPVSNTADIKYEVDDEGNPFYIVPCLKPQVSLFGAKDVYEVILFDPSTGESEIYAVDETPAWIDSAFDGYLAMEKYNWKGMYSGGWFNSVIGNKDCKVTTDDFGYIVIGDDVWYFTGVTSVNSDQSNIGFIISNARTGEYKFYPVMGAEEHSAMGAAEGEVQEKGYVASFPALINVKGEATYIMVLKDAGGLVKLYALVNVEQYNLVATGETQEKAFAAYKDLLRSEGVLKEDDIENENKETFTFTVDRKESYTVGGESTLYFFTEKDGESVIFKCALKDSEGLLFVEKGDSLTVTFDESSTKGIFLISSWKKNIQP